MNALELVPDMTMGQATVLAVIFVAVVCIAALLAYWADHVATEWEADQYDAGQSPTEGHIAPRRPRIPEQRRPDQDAS